MNPNNSVDSNTGVKGNSQDTIPSYFYPMPGSVAVARQPLELKSLVRIQAGQANAFSTFLLYPIIHAKLTLF